MVIGRKNWLFAATEKGAKASANLYSLVETAKANNVEPSVYLKEVFTRLPAATCVEDIEALLPWNIVKVVRYSLTTLSGLFCFCFKIIIYRILLHD
jgi:hypothetical protein